MEETKGYIHAWIVLENDLWLQKNGVTTIVTSPTKPKDFTGKTDAEMFKHRELAKQYKAFKTHQNVAI